MMNKPEGFACDACGAPQSCGGEWRVLRIWSPAQAQAFARVRSLAIYDWDDKSATRKGAFHSCGSDCTQTLVERYLAFGLLDAVECHESKAKSQELKAKS
jgi:hypothetical protein